MSSWTSARPRSTTSRWASRSAFCSKGPTRTFTITGLARFGTANNLAGATLAAFDIPTAQALLGDVGKFDSINVVAQPGADKATVQRAIARALPPGVEVVTGQTVVNEATSAISQALGLLQHGAAGLRVHRALRRRVHHPEHVLHHRGPAHARAGPAAHRRRQPPPGLPLGDARGGHRRAGVVPDRPRPGRAGRPRARGAPQRVRRHAAVRPDRLRGPHRHRLPRRGRRRDGGVGHQPGPAGRADRAGGRGVGAAERGRDLAAPPLHAGGSASRWRA